ncbi:dihydroxyacetone kinase subunit DhaL [Lichenicola cladoniae]|uniref:dihydroxyacetone kinase subunit DhaL n=1 Tax=Lichenicola cladoniae TaxID=1484109 RepID=UPI0038CF8B9D
MSLQDLRIALIAAAQTVIDSQDMLTKADQAIGDGDHGLGMARGFKAFRDVLEINSYPDVPAMLKAAGQAIMMTSGGASGVIFGTLFMGAAKPVTGTVLDGKGLAAALVSGLEAVRARGKANVGDKTMVDALAPAAGAALVASERTSVFAEVAYSAAAAAEAGLEATKAMVATTGKAKGLGERAIGFIDPGALTLSLFLRSFACAAAGSGSVAP